jgi:ribose transport system substrate-binding protein
MAVPPNRSGEAMLKHSMARRGSWRVAGGSLLVASTLLASACSSSSSSDSPSSGSGSSSVPAGVAQAEAQLAGHISRPTSISITMPVGKPIPKNKTVAFITCNLPGCSELTGYFTAAADSLGWKVSVYSASLVSPEQAQSVFQQVVRSKPDAIVATAFEPTQLGPTVLSAIRSLHVPFIDTGLADPPTPGVIQINGLPDTQRFAKVQADWLIKDSNGKGNIVFADYEPASTATALNSGMQAEISAHCPGCTYAQVTVPAANVGSPAATQQIIGYLQAHPDVDYLGFSFPGLEAGIPAALKGAGITRDIKFFGHGPNPQALIDMKSAGGGWGTFPNIEQFWRSADYLARYFAGVPTAVSLNTPFPVYVLTPQNVPAPALKGQAVPVVADYQAQYRKLWGLS